MDKSLQELSEMTFIQSKNVNISDLSRDIKLLNVVWAMDGSRDLKTVAREDAYDLEELATNVQNLVTLGALEVNQALAGIVDKEFFDILTQNLSQAIGPMADILVEDTISDMGHSISSFPINKLEKLVNQLAQEIQDENSSKSFKNSMAILI